MDIRTDRIIPIMDFMAPELDVYARLSETSCTIYMNRMPGIFYSRKPPM